MKAPQCPRCQSVFSVKFKESGGRPGAHPLLLRCGHNFCEPCLHKCKQQNEDEIKCPTCLESTKVSDAGADLFKSLNPDFYTVGIIWNRRMELEVQSQKIWSVNKGTRGRGTNVRSAKQNSGLVTSASSCSECHINLATCQCFKCDCIMCRPCFDKVHQMSNSLRKHHPVPYAALIEDRLGPSRKTRSRNCPTHEQCQIEYFCNDDNEAICSRCVIVGNHKGHDVQTMEDKNKDAIAEMEPAILTAQETLWRLEKSEQELSKVAPNQQLDTRELVFKVQTHFRHLHSLLQAREEQLLDQIKDVSLNGFKPFHDMKSFLQEEKLQLEMALVDATRVMNGNIHRLVDADLVLERLKKAKELACMITMKKEAQEIPIQCTFDEALKESLLSYGEVSSACPSQLFTLSVPGPNAPKPPVEELRSYAASDLDALSNADTESIADSASVIVEEEREDVRNEEEEAVAVTAELSKGAPPHLAHSKRPSVGHRERVRVTHIRTPAEFYVQLSSRQKDLEALQRQINLQCRDTGKKQMAELPEEGSVVIAQFSHDKMWYRARVQEVLEDEEGGAGLMYYVFFLDYGNAEKVPINKIRTMNSKFMKQPAFSYECSLYDILPADETIGWTKEAVETLLQMTQGGPMIMQVINNVGRSLEVDLSKPEAEVGCVDDRPVSVRDSLVFLEMAIFNTRAPVDEPAPRARRMYVTMPRVRESTVVDVGINCVLSPSLFYSQLSTDQSLEPLFRMMMSMQEVYREETRHLYTIFCPKKDMMCVAQYSKDNNWYRARITGLPGRRKVEVQFVDYGNTEVVEHFRVCKILDEFTRFPIQALECSLADVKPVQDNGQWTQEAKDWFKSLVDLQMCQMRITETVNRANCLKGVLYAISSEKRLCCVNYELVNLGYATSTGSWSQEESYLGITLKPDTRSGAYQASSPSSSTVSGSSLSPARGAKATPSPAKKQRSPRKSTKDSSSTPVKGSGRKNVAMQSVQKSEQGGGKKGEAGAGARPHADSVPVVISSYQSPAHFYIQLEEHQAQLQKLMTELKSYESEPVPESSFKEGDFCVVKYSVDGAWYRGKIVKRIEESDLLEVNLIDYGHMDRVSPSDVRSMKTEHCKQSSFTEQCHLANVVPAGTTDRKKWSNTAKEYVPGRIKGKPLFLRVEGEKDADLGLPVDILIEETIPETALEPAGHEYISLVSAILEYGLAIPLKKRRSSSSSPPAAQPACDSLTAQLVAASSPSSLLSSSSSAPKSPAPKSPAPGPSGVQQKEVEVVIVQPPLEVAPHPPPASSILLVNPVYVDYEGIIYSHVHAEDDEDVEFCKRLDDYARTEAPKGLLEVKIGQVCLAHFEEDHAWYRARILEINHNFAKVKYIDFGNTNKLDRSQLKLITQEFCQRPQMALELKLHNLRPDTVDGSWPVSFLTYMHDQIVSTISTAEIKGPLDQHPLEVDLVTKDGSSLAQSLLDIGVVVQQNDMVEFYERSSDITNILKHSNPFFPLCLGQKGALVPGLVTHVELPNLVYLQRCACPPGAPLPPDAAEFVQLMEDLNHLPPQTPALEEIPASGEMCSARFAQDNRWYRGLVAKAYPANKTALIFYVDYGNNEIVPLDRLRVLPQRFQDTPAQAVRAYLDVSLPAGCSRWSLDTYKAVALAIVNIQHLVLIKHTEPLTVELYCVEGEGERASTLSYQPLINTGLLALPTPLISACDDGVIVESESEEESSLVEDAQTAL